MIQKDADARARLVSSGWKDFFGELDKDGDGAIECEELVDFYVRKLSICGCGNNASSSKAAPTKAVPSAAPKDLIQLRSHLLGAAGTDQPVPVSDPLGFGAAWAHKLAIEYLDNLFQSAKLNKQGLLSQQQFGTSLAQLI